MALFQERKLKPHRADDSTRWLMAALSRLFNRRDALVVVKPDRLIRWHRKGFRLFWRWKSKRPGRPKLPANLRELIRAMATANPIWGEVRIADELLLKLEIRVSPRTVGKYLSNGSRPGRTPGPKQRWMTFVRNHAQAIVACDFFVVVTAFRIAILCERSRFWAGYTMSIGWKRVPRDGRIEFCALQECLGYARVQEALLSTNSELNL